jgi:hypothetical protein
MATGDKIGGMSLGSSVKTNASIAERFFNSYISNVTSKINEIVHFIYAYDSSGKGGVLNTPTDPRYTLGINFSSETGISPISSGIDGTSLYTFSGIEMMGGKKAYETLSPVFWKSDPLTPTSTRPRTIYETFVSVMSRFDSQLEVLRTQIVAGSTPQIISEYTKGFIGHRAFSPTGATLPGSMVYNIDYLLAKIEEIKEDVYGDQHDLRTGLTNTGQSVWSLLQIVDTLLELHGGADYMSEYEWDDPIVLNHDLVEAEQTPIPKVEFLPASAAERLIENASLNSSSEIRFLRDDNSYELALNASVFNDLLDTQEYNSVIIPYLPGQALFRQASDIDRAWHSGTATPYLTTVSRFTWSPGSELLVPEREGDEEDTASALRATSVLSVRKFNPTTEGLTISLVYEVIVEEGEDEVRCLIGNTVESHFRNIVEITGHVTSSINAAIDSDPKRVSITWKGSLEGSNDPSVAECSLRPGVNKVLLARKLQLSDFNINLLGGRSAADVFLDDKCFVDVMSINVIHRAEKDITADSINQVTLVGLEIIIEEV